jgi:hypothetical protein
MRRFAILSWLFLTLPAGSTQAVDYLTDIKPLLTRKCSACHGAIRQEAGMRLDAAVLILRGSDRGAVIEPGDSAGSLLIQRVTDPEDRMPPEGEGEAFTEEQINLLKAWIDGGAPPPANEEIQESPADHWSYQAPRKPPVPDVADAQWARNPIDAFIAAAHQGHGLQRNPRASRTALLRRVYLDLIGLPPTHVQQAAFLADKGDDAFENVVDRLLDSSQYGERWGRHWMDIWRYADWYGRRGSGEIRYSMRHIWRWRDWIIESLNADKGYDQMILEMLAGDEIAPTDPDVLRATGFVGRNWYKFNREIWMQNVVEHTSVAFLAVTMKCARCHDHKYEPIAQQEYYQLRSFFEPHDVRTDPLPGEPDVLKDGVSRVYDKELTKATYLFVRGDERQPDEDHPLSPAVPAIFGEIEISPSALDVPIEAYYPALQSTAIEARLAKQCEQVEQLAAEVSQSTDGNDPHEPHMLKLARLKWAAAQAELASFESRMIAEQSKYGIARAADPAVLSRAAANAERQAGFAQAEFAVAEAEHEQLLVEQKVHDDEQGRTEALTSAKESVDEARQKLTEARSLLSNTDNSYTPLGEVYPTSSSGRRLELARWITSGKNPRTARVAINHIWKRHFGRALVLSVTNFGLAGTRPSHPELLDWLACELFENRWSMKHIHRLIVASNTYRLSSATHGDNSNNTLDFNNKYLWRANSQRMESELIRDSMLHLSGSLDPTIGGPELDESLGQSSTRRSLYFRVTPDNKMELMELFDLANPNQCYERHESVLPQQALAMWNSEVAMRSSRLLAGKLTDQFGNDRPDDFLRTAFEQTLSRRPTVDECRLCEQFLRQQVELFAGTEQLTAHPPTGESSSKPAEAPWQRARENLVQVLFNHNDFVTIR